MAPLEWKMSLSSQDTAFQLPDVLDGILHILFCQKERRALAQTASDHAESENVLLFHLPVLNLVQIQEGPCAGPRLVEHHGLVDEVLQDAFVVEGGWQLSGISRENQDDLDGIGSRVFSPGCPVAVSGATLSKQ